MESAWDALSKPDFDIKKIKEQESEEEKEVARKMRDASEQLLREDCEVVVKKKEIPEIKEPRVSIGKLNELENYFYKTFFSIIPACPALIEDSEKKQIDYLFEQAVNKLEQFFDSKKASDLIAAKRFAVLTAEKIGGEK